MVAPPPRWVSHNQHHATSKGLPFGSLGWYDRLPTLSLLSPLTSTLYVFECVHPCGAGCTCGVGHRGEKLAIRSYGPNGLTTTPNKDDEKANTTTIGVNLCRFVETDLSSSLMVVAQVKWWFVGRELVHNEINPEDIFSSWVYLRSQLTFNAM